MISIAARNNVLCCFFLVGHDASEAEVDISTPNWLYNVTVYAQTSEGTTASEPKYPKSLSTGIDRHYILL